MWIHNTRWLCFVFCSISSAPIQRKEPLYQKSEAKIEKVLAPMFSNRFPTFQRQSASSPGRTLLQRIPVLGGEEMHRHYGKRWFDFIMAIILIALLSPLFFLVAVLVRLCLGAPILFCQERPGLYGKPFVMFKFRTMTNACDLQGNLLPDAERLPAFGRFLRSTSLDELPELFNVLAGQMSLVGPRPLLMEYLNRYTPEQARRHHLLPGITGWAQMNGRNGISWDEKFAYDVWYVDHCSFQLDLQILRMTFRKVIQREDINQTGHVTVEKFMGNRS